MRAKSKGKRKGVGTYVGKQEEEAKEADCGRV